MPLVIYAASIWGVRTRANTRWEPCRCKSSGATRMRVGSKSSPLMMRERRSKRDGLYLGPSRGHVDAERAGERRHRVDLQLSASLGLIERRPGFLLIALYRIDVANVLQGSAHSCGPANRPVMMWAELSEHLLWVAARID
jgi:hypothetical protein